MPPSATSKRPACDGVRAGERAALVAEELALDQRRRERAAVDDDEPAVPPRAALVDSPGDELLAGARLAEQEHRGVGRRDLLDLVHHVAERIAPANDRGIGPELYRCKERQRPQIWKRDSEFVFHTPASQGVPCWTEGARRGAP